MLSDSANQQISQQSGEHSSPAETQLHLADRHLLQTTTGTGLNPTLACEGCPSTDTRVRVNDTFKYSWAAVGMVTRGQQGALSRFLWCSVVLLPLVSIA